MKRAVLPLVSIACLAVLASYCDFPALVDRLQSVSVPWLALAFCFIALNLGIVSWRLHRILEHFGSGLPFVTSLKANASGLIASLFVVNLVGSVVGRHAVLARSGMSATLVGAISGYERATLALVGGGLFGLGALGLSYAVGWTSGASDIPVAIMVPAAVLATFAAALYSRSQFERLIVSKILSVRSLISFLEIALITLVGQLLTIATYAVVVIGLGHDINIWLLLGSAAVVSFAASVPISINGWGVREVASISVFGALGVPGPDALAASIIVGVCSTIGVLMLVPLLMVGRAPRQPTSGCSTAVTSPKLEEHPQAFLQKSASIIISLSAGILVFFSLPVTIGGKAVLANLGDPVVLFALAGVAATLFHTRSLPFKCPPSFMYWILGMTLLLLLAMINVAFTIGVTPWAINNRGIGWLIIIGYVCCGALIAGQFGQHGRRRLIQTVATTAACMVVVDGVLRLGNAVGVLDLQLPPQFEGFSSDRNAFAFQLVAVIAVFQAYMLPIAKCTKTHVAILTILIIGVILTKSTTGLAAGAAVLLLGLLTAKRRKLMVFALALTTGVFAVHYAEMRLTVGGHSPSQAMSAIFPMSTPSSINEHSMSIIEGLKMWTEHPIIGSGLGSFTNTTFRENGEPLIIHSTIVWVLAEMGLVGLVVVAWFPIAWLVKTWRHVWNKRRLSLDALSRNDFALLSLVLTFGVFSLAHDVAYQRLFWFLLGSLVSSATARQFVRRSGAAQLPTTRA